MISVKECRKVLTQNEGAYTDEEIKEIRAILWGLAEIEFNHFIKTKNHEKEGGNIH